MEAVQLPESAVSCWTNAATSPKRCLARRTPRQLQQPLRLQSGPTAAHDVLQPCENQNDDELPYDGDGPLNCSMLVPITRMDGNDPQPAGARAIPADVICAGSACR